MSKETIVLKSSDGVSFEVDEAVARQSEVIAEAIDGVCAKNGFPIANVTGKILAKVIEYWKKHVVVDGGDSSSVEDLKKWDAEFVQTDVSTIYDLILAANYLSTKGLLDLTCQAMADTIAACKDPDEIRAKFNIEKDFTPEEEAAALEENLWAFEREDNLNPN